jgi:hypothetical protein
MSEVSIWSSGRAARAASWRFWRTVRGRPLALCLFISNLGFLVAFGMDFTFDRVALRAEPNLFALS